MKRVTYAEFKVFEKDFQKEYNGKYKGLRLGQAFLNKYFPDTADSQLFYCESVSKTYDYIFTNYVDLSDE